MAEARPENLGRGIPWRPSPNARLTLHARCAILPQTRRRCEENPQREGGDSGRPWWSSGSRASSSWSGSSFSGPAPPNGAVPAPALLGPQRPESWRSHTPPAFAGRGTSTSSIPMRSGRPPTDRAEWHSAATAPRRDADGCGNTLSGRRWRSTSILGIQRLPCSSRGRLKATG